MKIAQITLWVIVVLAALSGGCASKKILVEEGTATPGGMITIGGNSIQLYQGSLKIGDNLIRRLKGTDVVLPFRNRVTIVSVVPSIDTRVCERQTHILDAAKDVPAGVDIITVSRDLPMAQARFAREAHVHRITFVSDYKSGSFGKTTGLMMRGKELLARALLVLDHDGVIRYIQVVPELSHLPDIGRAVDVARTLRAEHKG